jgi:NADH-ubiquinone oxidoreductase chain 2
MAFVGILTSVISASYYLRIVVLLFTESTEENLVKSTHHLKVSVEEVELNSTPILTNFHSFLISTITLSILLFIFKPTLILNSTQLLALSYFNY